ncbi:hypothetical protein PIROE2DRAFT_57018 [Piromyces sp. E2]|nr:hypothetical protein PIROE2DRAFT_57018 [Piromyces sp. E2]|eukprot:OUM70152.1 hypothetical protein PIROE2DRAFT_57018 [Piromyces sp. E2]
MFGNNNMSNNISIIQEKDSIMSDGNKPKNIRGRGPNKFNGHSSNNRPISERLGSSKPGLKGRIKDRKGGFPGKDDKKNKLNLFKNNGKPNLKDFHKSTHERVIASNAVGDIVDLQKLIKKKSKRPIKILKAERKNESIVSFLVENKGHAKSLLDLSGIRFNGNTVTFAIQSRKGITTASDIKNSISVIENLKRLILGRYNPEAQYLNLENINNDPTLDQEELPEGISFDVGKNLNSKTLPLQIKSSFIDSDVTANTIQDFIVKYFTLFDSNRAGLLDLYDNNALFSLSVNNNSPPWRKRYERGDNMSSWKANDRNFKSTRQSNRDNLLSKGNNTIIQTIAKLPSTKHPLEDNSKFIIDSWQINVSPQQVLIYLNISGEFKEVDIKLNKSFSRTFLIAPSQPQSNAARAGWAYTIFNDQLTVRPWSGNKSFDKAEANPIQIDISGSAKMLKNNNNNNNNTSNVFNAAAQLNTNVPLANGPLEFTPLQLQEQEQLRIQNGLNDMQHQQVKELSRQTHLTYMYSLQCLNEFQWNFTSALEGFQNVKMKIIYRS